MNKLKKNELGFGTVELVLTIALVATLGVIGWMVYKNHSKPATSVTSGSTAVTVSKLAWKDLPTDLQTAITDTWNTRAKGWDSAGSEAACASTPKQGDYMVQLSSNNVALGGVGCDGGSATIWAKVDGKWQFVQSTQFMFTCDNIDKYKIPKEILGTASDPAQCLDVSSNNIKNL